MNLRPADHVDELISAAVAGELTEAERATLDAHLADCPTCRETMQAFADARRLMGGMRIPYAPRDLGARVRTEIAAGRIGSDAWWRQPSWLMGIGASLATVGAAALLLAVLSGLPRGPVGSTGSPAPSASGPVPSESVAPSAPLASQVPAVVMQPGDLGVYSLLQEPKGDPHAFFTNTRSADILQLPSRAGPPIAAALSPDGTWLAYITQKGLSGANEAWVLNLASGESQLLGCSEARDFTDRLSWAPIGGELAYTLTAVDLGPDADCGELVSEPGSTDVWLWNTTDQQPTRLTDDGNSYAADFAPNVVLAEGQTLLYVSHVGESPSTEQLVVPTVGDGTPTVGNRIEGIFLPRLSPDGTRAIFWRGSMASPGEGSGWAFVRGGLPYLSGAPVEGQPSWSGEPLFTDLSPAGGEGFASGHFAWGPDSSTLTFWDGTWLGAPQSADGTYPGRDAYIGGANAGLLSAASRIDLQFEALGIDADAWIVDVAISPDMMLAAVTVGVPLPGDLSPAASYLILVPLDGGPPELYGGAAVDPARWYGPAVFGP